MRSMRDYHDFVQQKKIIAQPTGITSTTNNAELYKFQEAITNWALRTGKAAIFADCGLGKTAMQLCWADKVCQETGGSVIILTPLAVAQQTVLEAEKFGIASSIEYARTKSNAQITVANYEMLKNFNPADFTAVVLDESSILKNFAGKIRNQIVTAFAKTPYRLACTATPAPNDYMELANHAEFLGIMKREEMLATFFYHDASDTKQWILKGHARKDFWEWVCSWAVTLSCPSDIGFDQEADIFSLTALNVREKIVTVNNDGGDYLFAMDAKTMQERIRERKRTIADRVKATAEIANSTTEQYIVWCNLNDESAQAVKLIDGAVEIKGSDKPEKKGQRMLDFAAGKIRVLVTKPKIAGFGINWQNCHNVIFLGLSDSYEQFYQALRRCWRFGQKSEVTADIVIAETEGNVLRNIKRKEKDASTMRKEMVESMSDITKQNLTREELPDVEIINVNHHRGSNWDMYHGDCVSTLAEMDENSIDYSVFSPPFLSLYTYTDSAYDFGNCRKDEVFYEQFKHFSQQLYRVLAPGRLFSFHVANLPLTKWRDGVIGLKDFRGELIRLFSDAGFTYHSEVCIWKNPVTAMQRTKAIGLLYKQLRKDSTVSRQGIPDFLVTMKKPGENLKPVTHTKEDFPLERWQNYASPVWMDINQSKTLQYRSAKDDKDEKHICPLQLEVIERALELWTRKNDLVLSPFGGIGSEGYCAVKMGRRFVGIELKESYFRQAVGNLRAAEKEGQQSFDW